MSLENHIKNYLQTVQIGEAQAYHNLILFPLQAPHNGVLSYITLADALTAGTFKVTEISAAGSVPELLVINQGDTAVLLVAGKSETKIPVSCTEQRRWSYNSAHFSSSPHLMAVKSRARKSSSVSDS